MVLFNRYGLTPLALRGTGLDSVFRAAEDVAARMAAPLATALAPGAMAGYGELTRARVTATETGATLELIVPGFGPDDVELTVKRDEVTVQGERGKDENGRPQHRFARSWRLGFPIDVDSAVAKVENGVLTVDLPRHASEQPRSIKIDGQDAKAIDAAAPNVEVDTDEGNALDA